MSRRSYPRWSGWRGAPKGKQCQCCHRGASTRIEIQWDWSRSEDERYDVCEYHRRMAQDSERVRQFIAHLGSKDEYMATRSARK